MQNSFFKIFAYFNYILTQQEVLDPFVSLQPHISYSLLNESSDESKDETDTPTTKRDKGIVSYLELKFAVDYRDYFKCNTHIQKTVYLKKYKKKQSPTEKYEEDKHEPEEIVLPPEGQTFGGYTLDIIEENTPTSNEGEKKNYEELIILHTMKNVHPSNINTPFATISKAFTKHMIGEWEQRNNYAFRFIVELLPYSGRKLLNNNKKLIETKLFVLKIRNKGDCIEIRPSKNKYFHLGPKTHVVVKQSRLSKLVAPIREFFRRGNSD